MRGRLRRRGCIYIDGRETYSDLTERCHDARLMERNRCEDTWWPSLILGSAPVEGAKGYFIQPTIITNKSKEMLTTREETFAPVVGLYKFDTEEEANSIANDCDVGLGAFVITENIARSWRVAEALEVGMVGINQGMLSAAENPLVGVKESGYGREGGAHGIQEYLSVKSMLINVSV
ncbi:hypothetical protein ONS95_006972 [Cadophora gregata]|uniref:uncharacterized protein n=1 Tax=Cadophora gregata TaxID=51156 RepID=UPI0026DAB064|nr:uncharacterized protein ONS95_006972 [Cadophora gregata]KAK0101822.1 hypothetical protein ONS95_006972 [Cadophora gregata]